MLVGEACVVQNKEGLDYYKVLSVVEKVREERRTIIMLCRSAKISLKCHQIPD